MDKGEEMDNPREYANSKDGRRNTTNPNHHGKNNESKKSIEARLFLICVYGLFCPKTGFQMSALDKGRIRFLLFRGIRLSKWGS